MIKIRVQSADGIVETNTVCPGCWVDAQDVDKADMLRLEQEFGISGDLLTDIMDIDEQSRIEQEDDYILIIAGLPVWDNNNGISCFTAPLGMILFPDKIVTVCQRSSDALRDMASNRIKGFSLRSQNAFVLNMLSRAAYTFLRALKELNRNSAEIETALQKSIHNNELVQLLMLQKSLVYFTTSIKSNGLLLDKIQKQTFLRLKEDEQDLLEDVITENVQAMEMANIYSSILTGTMDAFASVISNNLNIVMKRLAIVNIILLIPTVIYSFYGMNVELPFQHNVSAVTGIIIVSLIASAVGVVLLNIKMTFKKMAFKNRMNHLAASREVSCRR
ncbi:MAG: magnesium transporter CorA family protein [Spirochaetaceae bacterium]|jgi:magnesium transporter|nr:magnesium transporter CorA family protein [Spirochaetaceae bacterium]